MTASVSEHAGWNVFIYLTKFLSDFIRMKLQMLKSVTLVSLYLSFLALPLTYYKKFMVWYDLTVFIKILRAMLRFCLFLKRLICHLLYFSEKSIYFLHATRYEPLSFIMDEYGSDTPILHLKSSKIDVLNLVKVNNTPHWVAL